MKNIIFAGGLGNQMFEYAFVLALRKSKYHVIIDTSYYDLIKMHNGYELDRVFGIKERLIHKKGLHILWLRLLNRIKPKFIYMTDSLSYNPQYIIAPKKYIWGYWQDEQYFKDNETAIRNVFVFKDIDKHNLSIAQEMKNCNSVSLHIRRGDYASFGMSIMGVGYYHLAVEYMKEKIEEPVFYVFSDDKEEAETIAKKLCIKYKLITHNKEQDSFKDMFLMSQCKHNVIANSSFSWWGAWLNQSDDKVCIAPKIWDAKHPDFHPQVKNWILV